MKLNPQLYSLAIPFAIWGGYSAIKTPGNLDLVANISSSQYESALEQPKYKLGREGTPLYIEAAEQNSGNTVVPLLLVQNSDLCPGKDEITLSAVFPTENTRWSKHTLSIGLRPIDHSSRAETYPSLSVHEQTEGHTTLFSCFEPSQTVRTTPFMRLQRSTPREGIEKLLDPRLRRGLVEV